ncbi:MAG: hypothetical protein U1E61_03915 [Bradyrhizobium sp.]
MAAIAQALSRAFDTIHDGDPLKQLVIFCAAGLLVSLLVMAYGLDLSPGLF